MGHARVQRRLAPRRELTPAERAEVYRHLASCPECQATADAYAEQNVILRTMPEEPVPAALRMRVMAATRAPIGPSRPWHRFLPALSAASAAVLLAAVVLFAWGHRPQGGGNGAVILTPTATAGTVPATPIVK